MHNALLDSSIWSTLHVQRMATTLDMQWVQIQRNLNSRRVHIQRIKYTVGTNTAQPENTVGTKRSGHPTFLMRHSLP